ncbi:hypothetical protein HNP84_006063 [Thermocatellispora tengchongensis]|uniref:DUF3592 domain-containing protein n=1 Tax=Thermocatellispora tengchongensis TaxID=1073253 RepID=A0A840PCA0_9ACTN|nr:hypothetical protein [Thermocatellispora tengchongensis]MBB5136316.1 hypothetical protein [Thermocatellispora tengchongensis]
MTEGRARRLSAFDVVVVASGVLLFLLAAQSAPAAVAAYRADGIPGTFTATGLECVRHPGHEQCTWLGRFVSADGRVRRTGVGFYGSDRGMFTAGESTRAYDIGRSGHVYGPGGSNEWVVVALMGLTGAALALWPVLRGRRRAPEERAPEPPAPE